MRIVIDCIPLLLRSAGVKTYLYNWFLHLREQAAGDQVEAWPYLHPDGPYSHECSVAGREGTWARLALLHAANYSGLPLLDWLGPHADVFHASQQLHNPPRRARLTATVHDLTCWLMPEVHRQSNVEAAKRFAARVVRRADALIAVSESTRRDAVRILGLPPERIEVIYPGVANSFFGITPEAVRRAAARWSLPGPYVLFVGTVEPRKNVDTLLDAWSGVARELRAQYDLVVAGPAGWADARTHVRLRGGEAGVRYLGYVDEADLPGLTGGAAAFVYPSLYEGFGLPVAQAMAAGVPVITSNVSSMPEVAGGAALLVDPHSASELTAAIGRLLGDAQLRAELASRGLDRSRRFRWEESARQSLNFFRKVCG